MRRHASQVTCVSARKALQLQSLGVVVYCHASIWETSFPYVTADELGQDKLGCNRDDDGAYAVFPPEVPCLVRELFL